MNIHKALSNLFLICIPLYFTQGLFFSSGGPISQFLALIWLLCCGIYVAIYALSKERDKIANALIVLWLSFLVYWLLSPKSVSGPGFTLPTFGDLKNASLVLLSYFPARYWNKKNIISSRWTETFLILMLLAAIAAYYLKRNTIMDDFGQASTNNTAYYFVVLLPLIGAFMNERRVYVLALNAIVLLFLLYCAKRGAIFCYLISLIIFIRIVLFADRGKIKLSYLLMIALLLAIAAILVSQTFSSSELLQNRLESTKEGDSSARNFLLAGLWLVFINSSFLVQLFGHGMSQTVELIGGYAHNDWMELLTNQGIFGVFIYLVLFYYIIITYRRNRHYMRADMKYMYLSAISCYFIRTIFSMGYLAPESAFFMIALGLSIPKSLSKI